MSRLAWAGATIVILMAAVAAQGGEFSTGDYFALKRKVAAERAEAARLQQLVDSLVRQHKAVETDPKVQERIAREQWGMIRPGERLYKLTQPDQDQP